MRVIYGQMMIQMFLVLGSEKIIDLFFLSVTLSSNGPDTEALPGLHTRVLHEKPVSVHQGGVSEHFTHKMKTFPTLIEKNGA